MAALHFPNAHLHPSPAGCESALTVIKFCTTMKPLELSPEDFRALAADVLALSVEYLSTLDARPVFPRTSGVETERLFAQGAPEHGMGNRAFDALPEVFAHSRVQNGRFFGYVQGSGDPVAALGDLVASVLNQNITAWRSSPAGVTIERIVVRWLAEAVGCHGFSGTLTGGGSAANLMGLAMARESRTPTNDRGIRAGAGVIYASEQVHMAMPKAVALLGIGRENLHYVPCDDSYRMFRQHWSGLYAGMRHKDEGQWPWSLRPAR